MLHEQQVLQAVVARQRNILTMHSARSPARMPMAIRSAPPSSPQCCSVCRHSNRLCTLEPSGGRIGAVDNVIRNECRALKQLRWQRHPRCRILRCATQSAPSVPAGLDAFSLSREIIDAGDHGSSVTGDCVRLVGEPFRSSWRSVSDWRKSLS